VGINGLSGEEHFHGAFPAYIPHHAYRRSRAEDTDVDSRHGEPGSVGGDGKVAHGNELATGGRRNAVDTGDYWLGHLGERNHHAAAVVEQLTLPALVASVSAHLLQVMTCAEALSFSGENYYPYRGIFGGGMQLRLEGGNHLAGERVESPPAIESECSDAIHVCSEDKRLLRGQSVNMHNRYLPALWRLLRPTWRRVHSTSL
jgi:hypothetical protein